MRLLLQLKPYAWLLVSFFFITNSFSQGNLLVTPVRVVFEGQKRIHELNLANTGKDTARYLISFIEIRMNANGTFEKITEPDSGQHFASAYLRFFPRSVVLPPNEAQVVKLQLTKASQLAPGEYRSHIYFRAVPNDEGAEERITVKDTSGISVKLTPVFGISIPVIVRVGEATAKVNLSDLSLDEAGNRPPQLNMVFNRTGNASVYGNVTVNHISPQGKVTKVGAVNGMAVYTPNTIRQFHLALDPKPGINYHTGKLRVAYTVVKENAVTIPLAQAELPLQ